MQKTAIVITDLHMGEGRFVNGSPNPIEYFEDDEIFYKTIQKITQEFKQQPITLYLNGDIFDFLSIKYKGKIETRPTDSIASYKIKKIIKGHPLFIKALQKFLLKNPTNKIVFIIGNHDLHLVFPKIQTIIINKIMSEKKFNLKERLLARERIVITFKAEDKDVLFIHGNDAEAKNVTPKELFITKHNFKNLPSPYLNLPFGAYMTEYSSKLAGGNWFCKGNYWIGRMEGHGYVFLETLFTPRKWNFAFHAISVLLRAPLYFRFSSRWWVRHNSTFLDLVKLVFKASVGIAYKLSSGTNYARSLMQNNPAIKTVFIGHEHHCKQEFFNEGKVILPGNWSTTFEANYPQIELTWKHFRWLEKILKKIKMYRTIFGKKTCHLHKPKKINLYSFGVCRFYKDKPSETEIMKYNPKKDTIEPL